MSQNKKISETKNVAQNRRAYFDYFVSEKFEAGIVLLGSEVKSLRLGRASIEESYVTKTSNNEIVLVNAFIPNYDKSSYFGHSEKRARGLLLHKKEIMNIINHISKKGYTVIPIKMYFKKGLAKLEIGLAKGKNDVDKRQTIKERDWKREQSKVLKQYNVKY